SRRAFACPGQGYKRRAPLAPRGPRTREANMKRVLPATALAVGLLLGVSLIGVPATTPSGLGTARAADAPGPAQIGSFSLPFAEPGPSCPHETEGSSGKPTAKPP